MARPPRVGTAIGPFDRRAKGVGDHGRHAKSAKVFQGSVLRAKIAPLTRRVILSDSGNFPSDLYMAEGLITNLGQDYELRIVAPEEVAGAIPTECRVAMITQVD